MRSTSCIGLATFIYPLTTKEILGYGPILQRYMENEEPRLGSTNRPRTQGTGQPYLQYSQIKEADEYLDLDLYINADALLLI